MCKTLCTALELHKVEYGTDDITRRQLRCAGIPPQKRMNDLLSLVDYQDMAKKLALIAFDTGHVDILDRASDACRGTPSVQ